MATEFSSCSRIRVDGSSLMTGRFGGIVSAALAIVKYESDVLDVLKNVYDSTWTATAVIDAILTAGNSHNAYVTIVPVSAGTLASAGPDFPDNAAPKDVM